MFICALAYSDMSRYRVEAMEGLENCIVVDGVPIIEESRKDRLLLKVGKEFANRGCPYPSDKVVLPWDTAERKSKGCV